jgi:hypothetical protein
MTKTYHHGNKAKERKFGKLWRWMNTPSWWTRMMMSRPQRKAGKTWERKASTTSVKQLDDADTPSVSKKPHHYYW